MNRERYKEFIEHQISIGQTPLFGWDQNIREFELIRISHTNESIYNGKSVVYEDMIKLECKYVDDGDSGSIIRLKTIYYQKKTYEEFLRKLLMKERDKKIKDLGI
jgi:hypothetical protein